jgi:hypothetical protein
MDVVYVAVSIVVYARFSVRLCFVRPELIANVLMVDIGPVIEDGDCDWLDRRSTTPRERACNIINPPEVTGPIRAIVRGCVVN